MKLLINLIFIGLFFTVNTGLTQILAQGDDVNISDLNNPASHFDASDTSGFLAQLISGDGSNQPGLLTLAISLGGFVLLLMLIGGGYTMLMNPQNPQAQEKGRNQITYAIVGFLLLFGSYWIAQIIDLIFGTSITGTGS